MIRAFFIITLGFLTLYVGGWMLIVDSVNITDPGMTPRVQINVLTNPYTNSITNLGSRVSSVFFNHTGEIGGVLIRFNDGFYGIWESSRFFYSPVVSLVMLVFGVMMIFSGIIRGIVYFPWGKSD